MIFKKIAGINLLGKGGRMPELDGIRGMALLFVMLTHMISDDAPLIPITGKLGVWLFFVLSSFLLSSYFLSAPEKTKDPWEWANYLVRRILRVYPLYVLVLLVNFYFFPIGGVNDDNLANHLLLNDGVNHFWTMPVEIHFYFILPLIVLFIIYVLRRSVLWTGLALAVSIGVHQIFLPPMDSKVGDFHLLTYLPVFLSGCFLATVYARTKDIVFTRRQRLTFDAVALVILAGICLTITNIWSLVFGHVGDDFFHKYFVWFGLAWAAFLWFTINGILVKKFFTLPFMRIWGVISYSAYLIHLMIIEVVAFYLGPTYLAALLDFLIVFPISIILHIIIERPSTKVNLLKLRARLRSRKASENPNKVATTAS